MHKIPIVRAGASLAALAALSLSGTIARATEPNRADVLLADFEGADYGRWSTTGSAFGTGPAHGALGGQMAVAGFHGHGLVNSYLNGDGAVGTLTSPEFRISRKYINFLIGGGGFAGITCIKLLVDGKAVRTATGPNTAPGGSERLLAETWKVADLQNKTARIEIVDKATGGWGHINVDDIVMSDDAAADMIETGPLYAETYRPQFHFSSATGWINDPNGMVYDQGEYHLFFQHNPFGTAWGHMTWGHAVSPDLVHWKQLDNALKPDALGTMYSGSAVVDAHNSTGFQTGAEPPIIAMYTAAGGTSPESTGKPFSQCIAYSNDRGRTWTKYAVNPVIPHVAAENRDPKVVWYAPTKRWIAALYLDHEDYALFSSPDMKIWTQIQTITLHGASECPDFFEMPLDGDKSHQKWVITGANGHYIVGSFDGSKFTPETPAMPEDTGANYYAVQTFSNIPPTDGRRIQISWMNGGSYPKMPFNQQMSFPCELTLHSTSDGPRLRRWPVREIAALHEKTFDLRNVTLEPGAANPLQGHVSDLWDIDAEIDVQNARSFTLNVRGQDIGYDVVTQTITCLGRHTVLPTHNNRVSLRLLVDRTSLELFGDGGVVSMTSCFLPGTKDTGLSVHAEGSAIKIVSLSAYPLRSAWPVSKG